jgi:putative ABC transport system substrate-binding protein
MRRRDFITLLGGAAATWPLVARAQQSTMPVIGFLSARSAADSARVMTAFRQGLSDAGYADGRNVVIEYRWAEGRYDRLPGLAAELVSRPVAAIVTAGNGAAVAAKTATSTIPTVFIVGTDPVEDGLVTSLARPGGNITGVTLVTSELGAKRLGLLREVVPAANVIAVLLNPSSPTAQRQSRDMEAAAHSISQGIILLNASDDREIEKAFSTLAQRQARAMVAMPDPFFNTRRHRIVALAASHAIPTIYDSREYALAGGLMSYGTSYSDTYRQAGIYAGRILQGTKPGDLPVLQPTKFELAINLKTAKALGLTVSSSMQLLADEVIE